MFIIVPLQLPKTLLPQSLINEQRILLGNGEGENCFLRHIGDIRSLYKPTAICYIDAFENPS